jgi:PAS domain S-box-containing protein
VGREESKSRNAPQTVPRGSDPHRKKNQAPQKSDNTTQILRAETRTKGAESRTEQAETRTEEAKSRTEQAETRTEEAKSRTERAETRTEQAKTRTERAETRMEQAETRSEQAIRDSEISYRRLFEATKDGILILEADTGRISDVNPFLVEMMGYSHDELVGVPIWELGLFKHIVSNKARFDQMHREGYEFSENLALETRAGRKMAVEFVSNAYKAGDRDVIQCNVRDITERKRAEDQIRIQNSELARHVAERTAQLEALNAELKSANIELDAFGNSVSHDLRAPVRYVLNFVEMLRKDAGSSLSPEGLALVTRISKVTTDMGKLIDDLLSFSRLGKSKIQKTEVNLDQLVQGVLSDFQGPSKERNIAWDIHPLPTVQADRALLRTVLVNLISNAVKFTGKRADPKIEMGCIPGGEKETVIFIRDNGAGFDQEYADKLFGVFQRLHSHSDFEGTGIGLANVQRIIHRHGGRTWAEGAVEKGATFYFSIPNINGNIARQPVVSC